MTRPLFTLPCLIAFTCIAMVAATSPTMAEMIVVESSIPSYKSDAKLADDTVFDLPKGATLKLLKQPDGTTRKLKGPYKGTLNDYASRPKTLWEKMFGSEGPAGPPRGGTPVGGTRGPKDTSQSSPTGGTRGIK